MTLDYRGSNSVRLVLSDKLDKFQNRMLDPYEGNEWEDECRIRDKLAKLGMRELSIDMVVNREIKCMTWAELAQAHGYSNEGSAWNAYKSILKKLKQKGFR